MQLSEEQKVKATELFKERPNLAFVIRGVFEDENLDGRTKEGRAFRKFLADEGLNYQTTADDKISKGLALTDGQKAFLMGDQIDIDMNALQIAKIAFKDDDLKSLSKEHRAVVDFLKEFRPQIIDENSITTREKWWPPKSISRAIAKINTWTSETLVEETMGNRHRKMCEKLLNYLSSPRFVSTINQFSFVVDRELFESEYVRTVWDKIDLTADEQNQYINICANYIRQNHIRQRLDRLNKIILDSDSEGELTMRITELIKVTSDDLTRVEKSINDAIKTLQGDRKTRLADKTQNIGSITSLVEEFQQEETRKRILLIVKMQNDSVEEEVDRINQMSALKARILGMSEEELL